MVLQGVKGTQRFSDRTIVSQLWQDMIEEIKRKRWYETTVTEIGIDTGENL